MPEPDLPLFTGGFEHHGQFFKTEFFSLKDKEKIPALPWAQVYVVGNYRDKVPVVEYEHSRDNLPGGGLYVGESIEDALRIETKEEINMTVLNWEPLGYQKVSDKSGNIGYQLRVYAELQKIGAFTKDPGGSVVDYKLIPIEDLNKHINYGEIGDWLVKSVLGKYIL